MTAATMLAHPLGGERKDPRNILIIALSLLLLLHYVPTPAPACLLARAPQAADGSFTGSRPAAKGGPYYELSYALPDWFPFPPGHRLVMESVPGSCDLLWDGGSPGPCAAFGAKRLYEPDPHVREAIASVLHGCGAACVAIDVGANIGALTAYMAALGARVVAVEPQFDLAEALSRTVALNGWSDRVTVQAGFAAVEPREGTALAPSPPNAFRVCGMGEPGVEPGASRCKGQKATPWQAPFINVRAWLRELKHVDLVKVDTDAVDGEILEGLLEEVAGGRANVTSVICEFTGGTNEQLFRFQQLGYTIYRLNIHIGARVFDSRGWDTLHNFRELALPWQFEERFFLRYIKYALKVVRMDAPEFFEDLKRFAYCRGGGCTQYLFTKLNFEEPALHHSGDSAENHQRWGIPAKT